VVSGGQDKKPRHFREVVVLAAWSDAAMADEAITDDFDVSEDPCGMLEDTYPVVEGIRVVPEDTRVVVDNA
jgi:hypothetical protein